MENENNNIISTEELNPNAEVLDVAVTPEDKFAGLQSDVEASILANETTLAEQAKKQDIAEEDIINLLSGNTEAERKRGELLADAGVTDKEERLSKLATAIEAEQQFLLPQEKLQKENEAIESGVTRSFLNRGISRSQRDSAVRQLGLAAEGAVLKGDIDAARKRIDAAINAEFGDQEGLLEARKFQLERLDKQVEDGKVILRADQKKKFDLQKEEIDKEMAEIKETKDQILSVGATAASNGAPAAVLQKIAKAKTPSEAMEAAGRYNVSISDRINQAKRADDVRKQKALEDAAASGALTTEQLDDATALRKEYNGLAEVKAAKDIQPTTEALLRALKEGDEGSGVADISAINSFQRLAVDPGVAVREGDVTLLQSAQSFGDKAWLRTQGYLQGSKLTDEGREQMRNLALEIHDARINYVEQQTSPIRKTADAKGIPFNEYIGTEFKPGQDILGDVNQVKTESGVVIGADGKISIPDVSKEELFGDNYYFDQLNSIKIDG